MKRTKEWWAMLTKDERRMLVDYEYENNRHYSGGGYLPEAYNECGMCSTPTMWGGLCTQCSHDMNDIIEKADEGMAAREEQKETMKNEPIAALVKDGIVLHVDYAPVKDCPMTDKTYGEVCIKCNICGRFAGQRQPTEAEVRGELEPVEQGWAYDKDGRYVHYFELHSSTAVCGYNGGHDGLHEVTEALIEDCKSQFCPNCEARRKEG